METQCRRRNNREKRNEKVRPLFAALRDWERHSGGIPRREKNKTGRAQVPTSSPLSFPISRSQRALPGRRRSQIATLKVVLPVFEFPLPLIALDCTFSPLVMLMSFLAVRLGGEINFAETVGVQFSSCWIDARQDRGFAVCGAQKSPRVLFFTPGNVNNLFSTARAFLERSPVARNRLLWDDCL